MVSRYSVSAQSETEKASDGILDRDIMTFPIESFIYTSPPYEYYITQADIDRPDILMSKFYGTPELDDIVAWLNDLPTFRKATVGQRILLPSKRDLEAFVNKHRV